MHRTKEQEKINDSYIATVVAQAIADVTSQEYRLLASRLQPFEVVDKITGALKQLDGLRRGDMPCYDDWTSLCYLTWYQPHHINLAYTLLGQMSRSFRRTLKRVDGLDAFRWIDFGCGSLPMHTALYAALATREFLRGSNPRVSSLGIDSSPAMVKLGNSVLSAIEKIDSRLMCGLENLTISICPLEATQLASPSDSTPTILSVMHAFYRENCSLVASELKSLIDTTDPELIIVTAHPASLELVEHTLAAYRDSYDFVSKRFDYSKPLRFSGELDAVTAFRQGLGQFIQDERLNIVNEGLSAQQDYAGVYDVGLGEWDGTSDTIRRFLYGADLQYIDDTDLAINFLNGTVSWSGAEAEARVYFRKQPQNS